MSTLTIEQLWHELRALPGGPRQRRVDCSHPLDLYADFEPPDHPGLVAVCGTRPSHTRPLRSLHIEEGARTDGRWSLRMALHEPRLLPVFAALCHDIVASTRVGVDEARLAGAVLSRIDRWRSLLERDVPGLGESALQGLIGELLVLEMEVLPKLPARDAVAAWTGPHGTPQDFLLPSGTRIEVKAIGRAASTVRVNGLGQLDAGADPLVLMVVRVQSTGASAPGAVTAALLVARIRDRLVPYPDALLAFDAALACVGWHEHPSHADFALRPVALEAHDIGADFPRLTRASVPDGVEDAEYTIALPRQCRIVWNSHP